MLCAEVGSKKPWRKEKIAFQNSPLSTYNWFLCARSRRSEDKWTPVYREDTRLQGRHRNGREGHPSTRRKPDQMFHVVSNGFACFLSEGCSAQKLEARNLGGRRKLPSRILLYPHIIGPCAPGAAGANTSGHPSTGRTPVYREDTRLQEGPQSTGRTPFVKGRHPSTRRTPVYREDTRLQGRHRHCVPSTRRTPVYREDTRLQGGHPSTRRTPVYREDTRLQGGHRRHQDHHRTPPRSYQEVCSTLHHSGSKTLEKQNRLNQQIKLGRALA